MDSHENAQDRYRHSFINNQIYSNQAILFWDSFSACFNIFFRVFFVIYSFLFKFVSSSFVSILS